MKNKFKEYICLSEEQKKKIWEGGIFVLDANVLLNMFRYSRQSSDDLFDIIKAHEDNLWLPYQVGLEFFNNYRGIIEGINKEFNNLLEEINSIDALLAEKFNFNKLKNDPALNIKQFREDINDFIKQEKSKIIKWQKEFEENDKEAILNKILSLFEGKVGDDYDDNSLNTIYTDGEKRYKDNIPPGYADLKEKQNKGKRCIYGDLIWWKQSIEYARDNKTDLVIVTDDKKEDWWYSISGKTIGPRIELIKEFDKETNGQSFLLYKTHQFMKMAKQFDGVKVSDSSIKEAKETSSLNYSQLGDMLHMDINPLSTMPFNDYSLGKYSVASETPALDFAYLSALNGIKGLRALSDTKGVLGLYDPISPSMVPNEDNINSVGDLLNKYPALKMKNDKPISEVAKKIEDLLRKKD